VREYLVIQEISYGGNLSDARLTKLTDALLDVENGDDTITDADIAGTLSTGDVDVQMIVKALDPAEAGDGGQWSQGGAPAAGRWLFEARERSPAR
jgi:hypothetical protein